MIQLPHIKHSNITITSTGQKHFTISHEGNVIALVFIIHPLQIEEQLVLDWLSISNNMKNRFFFIFILYVFSYTLLFAQETETAKTTRRLQFIEDFIATYEASYEKKKIDYIEKFFSNNALIITETKDLKLAGKALSPRVKKDRPYSLSFRSSTICQAF